MGEINLGFDSLSFRPIQARGLRRSGTLPRRAKVRSNLFGFVFLQRTGMRLFLGNANFGQHVENGFALDFQLSGQIVDSDLTHSPRRSSNSSPLSLHRNLTDSVAMTSPQRPAC